MNPLRLPVSVLNLAFAMGIGMSAATIAVRVAAILGEKLSGSEALGTLPVGMQVAGLMLGGLISSPAMGRFGRKPVLLIGLGMGVAAGVVGAFAAGLKVYLLLFPAHFFLGLFLSNIALLRFTAADQVSGPLSAQALSLTLFGGVLAAFLGPGLVYVANQVSETQVYTLSYALIALIALVTALLIALTKIKPREAAAKDAPRAVILPSEYVTRPFIIAVMTGAIGYGVMSLLMTGAALYMSALNDGGAHAGQFGTDVITFAIMWHVVAMFAPMVILPRIAARVGLKNLLLIGCGLLLTSAMLGMIDTSPRGIFASLIILGLGWAATYGGGGMLVKLVVSDRARFIAQGRNEFMVAALQGMGAIGAGVFLFYSSWLVMNLVALVLVALLIPLILTLDIRKFSDA